jgi:glycosyltransferase involved in cell wall biosynthesis
MTRQPGLVSTIIPVFNRPRLLVEAVSSVFAQTYRPIEIIIIDDGSTDDTPRVAQELAAQHSDIIRHVRKDNGGCAQARNTGLALAIGEFIQLLDSDDILLPDKFALQVGGLREHPDCGVSYCLTYEYEAGDPRPPRSARRSGQTFSDLFPALLDGRIWGFPSPLFTGAAIDAAGPFLESLTFADWEFECRLAAQGVRAHHCQSFLAETRILHTREGRKRGRPRPDSVRDSAAMHELILGHARRAGVPAADVDRFARRLFAVGRQCARVGLQREAARSLALALEIARDPWRRRWIRAYQAAAAGLGWHTVGRVSEGVERVIRPIGRGAVAFITRWCRRAMLAARALEGTPIGSWPGRLHMLWNDRPSRSVDRQNVLP